MKFWYKINFLKLIIALFLFIGIGCNQNNSSSESHIAEPIPLPPPPKLKTTLTSHKKKFFKELFKDCNLSGDKKSLVESCDFSSDLVRQKAIELAGKNSGTFNLGQVCDIFDFCKDGWKYVNDPQNNNLVQKASFTLSNNLTGDCDDFAVVICSMILSVGGEARINYAFGDKDAHAFSEVNIGNIDVSEYIGKRYPNSGINGSWTRTDAAGNKWLNLDWFADQPGGPYFEYNNGTTFYILQNYCEDFSK